MNDTPVNEPSETSVSREEMLRKVGDHIQMCNEYLEGETREGDVENVITWSLMVWEAIRADIEGRDKDFTPCVCPDFDKKKGCVTPGDECNRLEPF